MLASVLMVPALALGVTVADTFVAQPVAAQAEGGISEGANSAKGEGQSDDLFGPEGVFSKITNAALFVIGAVSVLMLIYGGIRYTISGGDSKAVTDAKNTILYAIIGIIVALLAYAIVNFVLQRLVEQ